MRYAVLAIGLVLLASCTGEGAITANDVVGSIPWADQENATYRVLDDDDQEVGTLELSIERDGDEYTLRQFFDFPDTEFTNEAEVVVDAAELQPLGTHFRIDGPEGVVDCTAEYEGSDVDIHRVGEDGERDDTLDVPSVAYDSWSDLFVWRTITFSAGYKTEYADILSCVLARPQRLEVTIEVINKDTIAVPAGTFETWRVEIDAGREQTAWFSDDEAHTLVKYDNGEQVFELVEGGE